MSKWRLFRKRSEFAVESEKALGLFKRLVDLKLVRLTLLLLFFVLAFPFLIFFWLRPSPAKEINYGVNFSHKYAQDLGLDWQKSYIKILDELGTKNLRLIAYWDEIERERDVYDFGYLKWQLDEAEKRNANVILAVGRKVPRYPECFEPNWWKDLSNETSRNQELYEYVKRVVLELKGYSSIKIWQVENEPFFPFGVCSEIYRETVENEVKLVKSLDNRPVLLQDSGEGGFWLPTYKLGDNLGISMYRKIWYDFWGIFLGRFIYFQYPLAHWTYKIKADLVGVPYSKIIVTELQSEPWGPAINSQLSDREKNKTMSRHDFLETLTYAQKAGFKDLYFWGAEWWLWEKEVNDNSFYWDTAKALFK